MDINTGLDELIVYAKNNLLLDDLDECYVRSRMLEVLGIEEYRSGNPDEDKVGAMTTPDALLDEFLGACALVKIINKKDAPTVGKRILQVLSMKPSRVNDLYAELGGKGSAKADKFLADYAAACRFGKSVNPAFKEEITDEGFIIMPSGKGKEELASVYAAIDALVCYGENNLLLDAYDVEYVRRDICDILGLDSYAPQEFDYKTIETLDRPDVLIATLKIAAEDAGVTGDADTNIIADRVMGALSLMPSEINDLFNSLTPKKATDFLYDYLIKNNYVKKTAMESNIRFKSDYTRGGLEITINKAQPECTDSSIEADSSSSMICPGSDRQTVAGKCALRAATIELGGEEWFWRYLPYGYLGKHGIAISKTPSLMKVTEKTVVQLMDFVDKFPHFFIGCDAALTGAGGSASARNHFQGGEEILPMHRAQGAVQLVYPKYPLAEVKVLDWYDSVIRVTSQSRQVLTEIEEDIRKGWENYTNVEQGIIAEDSDGRHNAVSLTMRKLGNGRYCLDIILRSNIKSDEYPDGVFHTHPEFQVLKKEPNGLLEAQGMFILPGRLERQIAELNDCLVSKTELPADIANFKQIYKEIIKENGREISKVEASIYIKAEFGSVCERILENIAVFKTADETADFLKSLGTFASA